MSRAEVETYLRLSDDQVQALIRTRQLIAILMRGEERFDSLDVDLLIDYYKATAQRRA